MGGVECVWVRNIFRQICMGTKYSQHFLYGYEIIFYKFGQKFSDHAQFLDLLILGKIPKERLNQSFLKASYIYAFKEYIWYIKLFDQLRTCWSCALSNLKRLEVHLLLES